MQRILLCKLNLPVQWVYDVLNFHMFFPQRVEHPMIARFYMKYEQNPMKSAHIDIHIYLGTEKGY